MELLYLSEISQLDYVLKNNKKLLDKFQPITGEMTISFELERLGINFIDEWDYITPEEIEANWNEANILATTWWNDNNIEIGNETEYILNSAQQEYVYPFQACLNAKTAYIRIFKKFNVDFIHGFFLPSVAVIRTGPAPTSRAVRSVSEGVLIYLAEKKGIPLLKLQTRNEPSYFKKTTVKKNSDSLTKQISFNKINDNKYNNKVVLVHKDSLRLNEYTKINKILQGIPSVRPITFTQECLEFEVDKNNEDAGIELFKEKLRFKLDSYEGEHPEIFSNPHIRFQFEQILNEIEYAKKCGENFKALLDILKPVVVIFGFESFTRERVLVCNAQAKNIQTIGLLHGGIMPVMALRGITGRADSILVWNKSDLKTIETYSVYSSRCKLLGCLQYEDEYINYNEIKNKQPNLKQKGQSKIENGFDPAKPLILIVTAEVNTGFSAPLSYPLKHRNALRELLEFIDKRKDLQFAIKPHPSFDYYELYRRFIDKKRPNLHFLEQSSLEDVIDLCDICLMINYCTTASLEAMLKFKPVVYYNNAVYPLYEWRDNLNKNGLIRTENITDTEQVINNILNDTNENYDIFKNAESQIKEILGIESATASARICDYLKEKINISNLDDKVEVIDFTHAFKNFVNGKEESSLKIIINNLLKLHSAETLMFYLSYFAGLYDCSYSSLVRIHKLLSTESKNKFYSKWELARWIMIQSFMAGRVNDVVQNKIGLNKLRFVLPYIINWNRYRMIPEKLKNDIIKLLFRSILGVNYSRVIVIYYQIRKIKLWKH